MINSYAEFLAKCEALAPAGCVQSRRGLELFAHLVEARQVHRVLMDRIGVLVEIVARNAFRNRGLTQLDDVDDLVERIEMVVVDWIAQHPPRIN